MIRAVLMVSIGLLAATVIGCSGGEDGDTPEKATTEPKDTAQAPPEEPIVISVDPEAYLIDDHRAGMIQVGEPFYTQEVPEPYRFEKTDDGYELFFGDDPKSHMTIRLSCPGDSCLVDKVFVTDPTYRTSTDVGIGSSVNDLLKFYEEDVVSLPYDAEVLVYVKELPSVGFRLDTIWASGDLENIPTLEDLTDCRIIGLQLSDF